MPTKRHRTDPMREFDDLAEIGSGTFARVYRAVDSRTGQQVALKILRVRSSRAFDVDMFDHEARTLGPVSAHPHIVTLYRAFVSERGEPVLVMELCRSSMASALVERGPMTPREAVAAAVKLSGALETAHRADIVHRDIKPQNVLLTSYGEPALADFGVAALRSGGSPNSPSSAMTLFHAAPEVVLGAEGDQRSDVYSLASTVYELIEGHPPFFVTALEDPREVQTRVLTKPAPRLSGIDVPLRLADLLRRSLSKDPQERPQSALELAQLLRLVEEGESWPITPCVIAGLAELPDLEPAPPRRSDPDRASRTTSIPPLGFGRRSFREVPVTSVTGTEEDWTTSGRHAHSVDQSSDPDRETGVPDEVEVPRPTTASTSTHPDRAESILGPGAPPGRSVAPEATPSSTPVPPPAPDSRGDTGTEGRPTSDMMARLRSAAGISESSPASDAPATSVGAVGSDDRFEARAVPATPEPLRPRRQATPPDTESDARPDEVLATDGEAVDEPGVPDWGFPDVPLDGTVTRAGSLAIPPPEPARRAGLFGRLRRN